MQCLDLYHVKQLLTIATAGRLSDRHRPFDPPFIAEEYCMCECSPTDAAHASTRRHWLVGAATAAIAALSASAPALAADTPLPDNRIGPAVALDRLRKGNDRYVAGRPRQRDYSVGRVARTRGQRPFAAVLSCADSRVAPELAFDQGPGDLFVVRLAGNFVNDDALASMEYAAKFLEVPLFVVLGHDNCGAVDAALKTLREGTTLPGHLPSLAQSIQPAVQAIDPGLAPAAAFAQAIQQNVRYNVERLRGADPILADMVTRGSIQVAGGVYELGTGRVRWI